MKNIDIYRVFTNEDIHFLLLQGVYKNSFKYLFLKSIEDIIILDT